MVANLQPTNTHGNPALGHLQNGCCLLLARVLQVVSIHRDDLIALHQPAIKVSCSTLHHLGYEHSWTRFLAHDRKPKPHWLPFFVLVLHNLNCGVCARHNLAFGWVDLSCNLGGWSCCFGRLLFLLDCVVGTWGRHCCQTWLWSNSWLRWQSRLFWRRVRSSLCNHCILLGQHLLRQVWVAHNHLDLTLCFLENLGCSFIAGPNKIFIVDSEYHVPNLETSTVGNGALLQV